MRLVWFRNDLRVCDNPALYNAAQAQQGVTAVVTLTPDQWRQHGDAPARLAFWWDNVRALAVELAQFNIPLRVLSLTDYASCAPALRVVARQLGARSLHFNREWPLNELRRDEQVISLLSQHGVSCDAQACGDLIIAPQQLRTGQGTPFKVFTPFARSWRRFLLADYPALIPLPAVQPPRVDDTSVPVGLECQAADALFGDHYRKDLWPAGEVAAGQRLQQFLQQHEPDYAQRRDYPAQQATSTLSPWLACGVLSPRQCLLQLQQACCDDSWLESSWLTELIWREFYRHLLVDFPQLSQGRPFRPAIEQRIQWHNDPQLFQAWCQGETGFALVDAGMHQLRETGWMHNRLRMLTASFLTKLLRIDWRWGERFFMAQLIDGDFASNRGGWQWSASVGADAAPYFRIFNPQRQLDRFDPRGQFVQQWLPAGQVQHAPVIDYAQARKTSLALYESAKTDE